MSECISQGIPTATACSRRRRSARSRRTWGSTLRGADAEALLAQYDVDKRGAVDLAELASIIVELEELKAKQQGQLGPLDA